MSLLKPHITVACVVERGGQFLMVEERDKTSGRLVFNQPAGHVEDGESLAAAALRETLEETGWVVELTGVIGVALYTAPANGATYCRTTFRADPLKAATNAEIDPDIHRVLWMDYASIVADSAKLRSPLVLAAIERYRRGMCFPLEVIDQV